MLDHIIHQWLRFPYYLHMRNLGKGSSKGITVVFIHGLGSSGKIWDKTIQSLPSSYRTLTIDLLGFGNSARPPRARYDAKLQARSVLLTLLRHRVRGKVIIVGHSLGSLVGIEIAKMRPRKVIKLVLCSPPLYNPSKQLRILPSSDKLLRDAYHAALKHPERFSTLAAIATKYKLVNEAFNVTPETVDTYMNTLESAILNQTAHQDIQTLKLPIVIIRGVLDPFVVSSTFAALAKKRSNIAVKSIVAGHEIKGIFVQAIVKEILATK